MSKYLDENGLTYLWSKIKGTFVAQVSGKGLSTNDYTTAEKDKLAGLSNYTHPTYTAKTNGLYKVTVDGTGHVSSTVNVSKSDITALGIPSQDTTYSDMTGATATADGTNGLVPKPSKGDQSKFLRADGTWSIPSDTTYNLATTTSNGLMSSSDKTKLNGIETGANKYVHPTYTSKTSGLYKITVDGTGHVSGTTAVSKADITALGIPSENTEYLTATQTVNGLMSSTDKKKLDGFLSASSYALKTDLTGLYKYKGSIATDSLPTTGQVKGDVYNLTDASEYGVAGTNVAWTGEDWDALGGLFVINSLSNSDIDTICK
jgi:hypothetical protein